MIGVFDSGVGGMSVVAEIRAISSVDIMYVSDSGRAPYGRRPLAEVRTFATQITDHLLAMGATMVVVACNAASAAALHHLRSIRPAVPFVGMEPAVKPAAALTTSGTIGVLTTAATFQGELFASVIDRFGSDVDVLTQVCDGWVELVEAGVVDGPECVEAVGRHVEPLVAGGADTLVLGCTHYPFLAPVIRRIAGPGIRLIDPGPAVARQTVKVAESIGCATGERTLRFHTSGTPHSVASSVASLTGLDIVPIAVTFGP
ncbi:MAG: glutamate racemase [Acidimicrobiia bacterium]|nr:glutamate racemase [Acidimicrobiia bacterium]MDH5293135.1 glutamate racemase [Acidimicrobiia bacterium]